MFLRWLSGFDVRGLVPLAFALIAPALLGQQETGSIVGLVSDPTGAVVAGAQVEVRNESTGQSFLTQTDRSGTYRAPQLTPGLYTITVRTQGFATLVRPAIEVRVADRLRVDLPLQVGRSYSTGRNCVGMNWPSGPKRLPKSLSGEW